MYYPGKDLRISHNMIFIRSVFSNFICEFLKQVCFISSPQIETCYAAALAHYNL